MPRGGFLCPIESATKRGETKKLAVLSSQVSLVHHI